MKIRCINNKGIDLRPYEYKTIYKKEAFGRFGTSEITQFDIEINKEYFVMGIIIFESYQAYLIDDNGFISTYPCQLFEIIESNINSNWYFRLIEKNENIYPFVQAIFGYPELCSDRKSYEKLIVEKEESYEQMYFIRKKELVTKR